MELPEGRRRGVLSARLAKRFTKGVIKSPQEKPGISNSQETFGPQHNSGDVFCPGAALALVGSTEEERLELGAAAHVEGSDALGRVDFVAGEAEQVTADGMDVHGYFGDGLNSVGMEPDVGFLRDAADLVDRLDDAGFIVRHHDADKSGVGADGAADVVGIDAAIGGDGKKRDLEPALGQALRGVEHGMMFDR